MSILKPDTSVIVGVSTAALVGFVYQFGLPNLSTVQATGSQDRNIEAGRKKAAWTSATVVAGLSLLTKDKTVFVIGGVAVIFLDWQARHANAVSPETGRVPVVGVSNQDYAPAGNVEQYEQQAAESYGW
jgi:hypothetical protein